MTCCRLSIPSWPMFPAVQPEKNLRNISKWANDTEDTMKRKLTPEASGTLAALNHHHKIKSFSPERAEELVGHGFAVHKGQILLI